MIYRTTAIQLLKTPHTAGEIFTVLALIKDLKITCVLNRIRRRLSF